MSFVNALARARPGLAGIASLLLLGCGSSAGAKPSVQDCLWNGLSSKTRASIYQAYDTAGTDGLENINLNNAEVERLHSACVRGAPPSTAQLQATGIVLVGVAQEHAAARHLAQVAGVPYTRFRDAWQALSSDERQHLLEAYRKGTDLDTPTIKVTSPILDKAAQLAGWKPNRSSGETADQLFHHYIQVFLGMAQSEAYADAL